MRIENKIYFAPGIKFIDLSWDDPKELLKPFEQRVRGYFLDQAYHFISEWNRQVQIDGIKKEKLSGLAFGCGVICTTTIDFLAAVEFYPSNNVGDRYKKWLNKHIPILKQLDLQNNSQTISARFYDEYRNGLVHEGRIKNAGQFSFDNGLFPANGLFEIHNEAMVVNPEALLSSIENGLYGYIQETERDEFLLQKFRCTLINFFSADMEYVKKHG